MSKAHYRMTGFDRRFLGPFERQHLVVIYFWRSKNTSQKDRFWTYILGRHNRTGFEHPFWSILDIHFGRLFAKFLSRETLSLKSMTKEDNEQREKFT